MGSKISRRKFNQLGAGIAGLSSLLSKIPASTAKTLASSTFRLPGESDLHLRTFMQWPVSRKVYSDPMFLDIIQQSIADIANTIVQFEPVVLLMDAEFEKNARKKLSSAIDIWDVPTDDLWCRDSGPVFVANGSNEVAISHFNFNGWGNKQVHGNDAKVAAKVAERLNLPLLDNGLVGEPGGVDSDGAGMLIAHESSWVNTNRNKGTKTEVEQLLLEATGGEQMIWAPGIKGADITDYHIDSLARFIKPGVLLIQLPEKIDRADPWSIAAYETYEILKNATHNLTGRKLDIVVVPEPTNTRIKSADFVASYVNYYICNGTIIMSQFGDEKADRTAKDILATLYPDREIIPLNIDPIGEVGGGIHCATQQQPLII